MFGLPSASPQRPALPSFRPAKKIVKAEPEKPPTPATPLPSATPIGTGEVTVAKQPAVPSTPPAKPIQPPAPPEIPLTPPTPPGATMVLTPQTPSAGSAGNANATPGTNLPQADPAPASDQESDPFAKVGSFKFTPGRIEARMGRKVKSVRPRLDLKGQIDLAALPNPSVWLKVKIDNTGKVIDIQVVKSSGSNEIDLPSQLAVWKWWFEPLKDASGQPQPDSVLVRLSWQ
jgi:TonB family protein